MRSPEGLKVLGQQDLHRGTLAIHALMTPHECVRVLKRLSSRALPLYASRVDQFGYVTEFSSHSNEAAEPGPAGPDIAQGPEVQPDRWIAKPSLE